MSEICFVLMPFSDEFKNQWDMAFKPAIQEVGLTPFRGDEESFGSNMIMRDITKHIYESKIVIADISGKNPNVMYELGLAHAAKKKVIILMQRNDDCPFDISHIRRIQYTANNLLELRKDLTNCIKRTLQQDNSDQFDFFPELEIITEDIRDELKALRQQTIPFKIRVTPQYADIFFNDKLIGTGSAIVQVSINSKLNTIACAALEHYEEYIELTQKDIKRRYIEISLDPREDSQTNWRNLGKRVSKWLRFRKKNPDNPVLMRAIIQFLLTIEDFDEAKQEVLELLEIAPSWYMARNVAASVYFDKGDYEEAIRQYKFAIDFQPKHAIGYLGLACAYSRIKKFDKAISQLEQVRDNPDLLDSYRHFGKWKIQNDPDFSPLKESPNYRQKFDEIVQAIDEKL